MTTTATYSVTGMTCSHCVAAVTEEVSRLDGVSAVDLNAGGDSRVTVTSSAPLPRDAVREAVDEAESTPLAFLTVRSAPTIHASSFGTSPKEVGA